MNAIKSFFTQNKLTTFFGILGGLPGLVLAYCAPGTEIALSPTHTRWLMMVGAIGFIGLGITAKAFNTHSTTAQVQTSTLQNPQIQAEAVVEAKAEAKAVPSGVPIQQPVPIVVTKAPEVKP